MSAPSSSSATTASSTTAPTSVSNGSGAPAASSPHSGTPITSTNNAARAGTAAPASQTGAVPAATGVPAVGGVGSGPPIITGRPAGVPPLGVREDTTHHASLFIGDLSPEVNDATLRAAFAAFPSLSECRVMYDPNTGRSRGYGFASFGDPDDAHRALSTLNGEWLGSRPLRINWANQKHSTRPGSGGSPALDQGAATMPMSYEQIVAAAPSHNTTVYLGNLHPMTTQQDIVALFSNISFVREVRLQAERGYGFAVLDSHDAAATAIFQLGNLGGGSGVQLHGRVLRVSWGKDRNDGSIVPQLPGGGLAAGLAAPNVAGLTAGMAAMPNVFGGIMYQAPPGGAAGLNYHTGFALPTSAASFGLQQTGHGAHNGGQVSGIAGINNGALGHLPSFAGMNVGNGPANSGATNTNTNNATPGAFGNQQRSFYSAAAPAFNNGSGGAGAPAPGGAANGANNYLSNAFNAAPVSNAIKHH